MKEELPRNQEVIHVRQTQKLKNARANPVNLQRHHVSAGWLIFLHLLALAALILWLLRLLGVFSPAALING